ncbi:MAG: DUF3311 domain-containing protein [Thermoanaerobaculia bacterium]|nr:DUF3311 domain-containing protein [Thermoanaerobaculia bacterium]
MKRALGPLGFLLLYLLHQDLWLWDDASLWLGLPAGLTYHALYCVATTIFLALLTRIAWPAEPQEETET